MITRTSPINPTAPVRLRYQVAHAHWIIASMRHARAGGRLRRAVARWLHRRASARLQAALDAMDRLHDATVAMRTATMGVAEAAASGCAKDLTAAERRYGEARAAWLAARK